MKNILLTRVNEDDSTARKAVMVAVFTVEFVLCMSILQMCWNKFISGTGFRLDVQKLPGTILSGVFIGFFVIYFSTHARNNRKSDETISE